MRNPSHSCKRLFASSCALAIRERLMTPPFLRSKVSEHKAPKTFFLTVCRQLLPFHRSLPIEKPEVTKKGASSERENFRKCADHSGTFHFNRRKAASPSAD